MAAEDHIPSSAQSKPSRKKKHFVPIENNPSVLTALAHTLGLHRSLAFHDVFSLTESSLLSEIPRPVYALLAIIPSHPVWLDHRTAEEASLAPAPTAPYRKSDPVLFFPQTIRHACGTIGLLHCVLNVHSLSEDKVISRGSTFDELKTAVIGLTPDERARLLEESDLLEAAHEEAALRGDTEAPDKNLEPGHHFVAFVKGKDGHLYEIEGDRGAGVDRGVLAAEEDLLSERAIELGLGKVLKLLASNGELFKGSVTVLAEA